MAKLKSNREISQQVTRRILKFIDAAINTGEISGIEEVCEVAEIEPPHISAMRKGSRYFTLDQLFRIGSHFDLDMNTIIYGSGPLRRKKQKKQTALDQLKEAVTRLEIEENGVSNGVSKVNKK